MENKVFVRIYEKKTLIIVGLIISLILFSIITNYQVIESGVKSFLNGNRVEVPKVTINSSGWSEDIQSPGSWHIDKSAEWTSATTAKISFDVVTEKKTATKEKNKDIILILDVSGSMRGEKLDKVKSDAVELVDVILGNHKNHVALVTFETKATKVYDFADYTKKDELINSINALADSGNTNYADAMRKTGDVLESYVPRGDTDLVGLFLSDGYPCEETGSELGEYKILKDNHPYLEMNAIQYEMGSSIIKALVDISDHQYSAYVDNLKNVLFEASSVASGEPYEEFTIVDYIKKENFYIENLTTDIKVSQGTFEFDEVEQKITWHLSTYDEESGMGTFISGGVASMTINATVKEDKRNIKNYYYDTNEKEIITSKLPNEDEEHIDTPKTPVLHNGYEVIYDNNPPTGCNLSGTSLEVHPYLDNVTIKKEGPGVCAGYQFRGWEIIEEDSKVVTKINDTSFKMPKQAVHLKGIWTKLGLTKSLNGTVYKVKPKPLIELMTNRDNTPVADTDINFGAISSDTNGKGLYIYNRDGEEQVYYYRGAVTNNNIIYAEHCWKIVRTTETGGIKLIYNGKPTADKQCTNKTGSNTQIKTSAFNSTYNNGRYIGYMYSNDVTTYTSDEWTTEGKTSAEVNVEDSTIKKEVDTWYKTNIYDKGYSEKLEDAVWCNDRSGTTSSYGARTRLYTNKTPSLVCKNDLDKFTAKEENGNGALTKEGIEYKVGLITADEASLGGLVNGSNNSTSYLYTSSVYWTLSPFRFNSSNAYVWNVRSTGVMNTSGVNYTNDVRPAVSLAPGTEVLENGDGTSTSPYVVQ